MNKLLSRLGTEFSNRGAAGFLRFVLLRLAHSQSDVLFEVDPAALGAGTRVAPMAASLLVDRYNLASEASLAVEAAVLTAENHAYREALQGDDLLVALTNGEGAVTSYGFVLFDSFYKRILGEASATPMISNCVTFAPYRRQGLYARLLVTTCRELAARGYRRVVITCAPDNVASMRGIENAGFRRVKTLHSIVLFARWIVWQRSEPADRTIAEPIHTTHHE